MATVPEGPGFFCRPIMLPPQAEQNKAPTCQLCDRQAVALTRHHLVPRSCHHRSRIRRRLSAIERAQVILICRPCHSQIHRLYSAMELALHYHHLAALRQDPALVSFVRFIRKQAPTFKPRGHRRRHRIATMSS
ncbi:MAG: hypothetical protein KDK39_06370 [Leptospiraceae bacterium]|nr:hypothetical protein [Leptospiraceae bacterium]